MKRRALLKSTAALAITFAVLAPLDARIGSARSPQSTPAKPPLCAPVQLTRKCVDYSASPLDLRKTKTEADGVKFNFFLWGKREHHDELAKFASHSSEADQKRALALIDIAKKYAVEYVTGGRNPESWSVETKTIVERIGHIEFRISDSYSSDCFEATDPGLPQAVYSPMEHAIGLCHSLVKTHSNVIMATILHEIGHAVSTCNMKKQLLRHKELTNETFSCLHEAGADLESEEEVPDRSLARSISEIKFGLDVNATNTETLIRCGAVERIPNSNLENVQGNSQFDQCASRQFANDYDRYVARFSLHQETLPKGLTPKEQNIVDWFKESNPQSCYRKAEEHFADTFAAQALALWHKSENKKPGDLQLAVDDLSQIYCMGHPLSVSSRYLYPDDDVRLLSYLAVPYFQSQMGCVNLIKPVCTLPEDPAALTSVSTNRSSKRGTRK